MNYLKAADEIVAFIHTNLTNKLADIYKETEVAPSDALELFKEHLSTETSDIVNEAYKIKNLNLCKRNK